MALYLDGKKLKVNLDGKIYRFNLLPDTYEPVIAGIKLLSSEGYILKDINGIYLTTFDDNGNVV